MDAIQICTIAAVVIGFGLVSRRLEGTSITMPMVFVVAGIATESLGLVDAALEPESVTLLAEVTLGLILFSDAARIDTMALRRELGLPARLLGIGLPLTILLGTFMVALLLPDLGIWDAALVAAILAPTDAALGQAVVEERSVPIRIRQGLNVESGLNDGIALPAVFLFAALAAGEEAEAGFWVEYAARQIGFGAAIGLVVGLVGATALEAATARAWINGIYAQLSTLCFAIMALAGATVAGGNSFIAVFVAGLVFGARSERSAVSVEYAEDTSRLLAAVTFFIFGNVLVPTVVSDLTVGIAFCVIGSLTIGRMLPVAVATLSARPDWRTVAFLGWFGPRGIASVVFALLIVEEAGPDSISASGPILTIVSWTVLGSVMLHGITAGPGAKAYGRWYESMTDEHDHMVESVVVTAHPIRCASTTDQPEEQHA